MDLAQYRIAAQNSRYRETLECISGMEVGLKDFLKYNELDLEVKVHITKVILGRHFESDCVCLPEDVDWFLQGFLSEYKEDLIKPWITDAIKEAISMILSGDTSSKKIIATTFMFGVIEYQGKYRLGYRPDEHSPFDSKYHAPYRSLFLGPMIGRLKKNNTALARDINELDKAGIELLKRAQIPENTIRKARMADRLTVARNAMTHGESYSFSHCGRYLAMIYLLFHFHGQLDLAKVV